MDEAGGWEVRSPKANKTITQMGDDPMNMSLDDIQATERKYTERSGGRRFNREGAMVRVHNLDPDATAADIQATFSEFGAIIKCAVEYDAATKSGTADIVFKDKSSVRGAIATYNGVVADGRTLKVEEIVARGIQITGRSTAAAPTHSVQVSVLKTSVGSVVVGGMYSDRIAASEPAAGRMDSQGARKVPITERLGTRSAR
ncbi:hypothetical protein BC830DRAFT_441428 [Chytriomyces sp. MP71]|nr:hypothetical protein BC830DRAFT_441428 [Chytriomyces sp. MP71]